MNLTFLVWYGRLSTEFSHHFSFGVLTFFWRLTKFLVRTKATNAETIQNVALFVCNVFVSPIYYFFFFSKKKTKCACLYHRWNRVEPVSSLLFELSALKKKRFFSNFTLSLVCARYDLAKLNRINNNIATNPPTSWNVFFKTYFDWRHSQ